MNLTLKTQVKGNYRKVMERFDLQLFEALKPPVGKMEIVEFTGSKKGDRVHLRFVSPIKAEWISDIIKDDINEERAIFVDVGRKLPWPLATWTHRHVVEKIDEDHSMIVDDMTFTASNPILTLLMYPAMLVSFYPSILGYRVFAVWY